jgi:hypothetical protein
MASLVRLERFQTEEALDTVRRLLGWSAPVFAERIRAGTTPLGDLAAEEFVLFVSYLSCVLALPISSFFLLLLEEFGLQLQHLTPHSILQVAIFVHLCEMFVGVAACTSLFRQFFVLVRSGKGKDHLGAYYFQTRSDPTAAYIATLAGTRWENWHNGWVIASAVVNDHLALPSDGPRLDRKQWRAKLSLAPEFEPVLDMIKELAAGGLTSMHVVGDFLKRQVMPLQGRPHLCCWYTSPNDIGRVQRGPETDLSWELLEISVKGITGEAFIPESLIPPQGIPPLCDDPGLRSAVLSWLPTLDESGVAVRETGGRDPHQGIRIPGVPVRGSQPANAGSRALPVAPNSSDKGKGAAGSSSSPGATVRSEGERRHRLRCTDGSFVSDPPLDSDPTRNVRGRLAGPWRPAHRPRAHRCASVLLHHHHQTRRHRHCHHHQVRRRHPRGSSSISSSNRSSRGSEHPASRVAGRSRAPSKCAPFYFFH